MTTDALELRVTALLLRTGARVHALSTGMLLLTGLWLVLAATVAQAPLDARVAIVLGLAAAAGLVQAWFAARIDFDAGLLLALAAREESGAPAEAPAAALDRTLLALGLIDARKACRDWPARRSGMRRLMNLQRLCTLVQATLLVAAWLIARP